MTTKLLLDTDIGSDIDDALCLAYLLAQPQCELLGITTVTGEADKRAMMANALCRIAGKQIPIFPGVEEPLLAPVQQPRAPQAVALDKWAHETNFPRGEAIPFLRQTIRAHPGEVTLLGIGPLTNIALLFASDTEIPALLKSLVLICGTFQHYNREWNALNDPHATTMVYRAAVPVHRSIGLDVTTCVTMDAEQFRARCTAPLLQPILDFAGVWFQHSGSVTFHDPLAATTIFDDSICTFQGGTVQIEMEAKGLEGKTYWEEGGPHPRYEIALEIKPERFFEHYFGCFARKRGDYSFMR